MYSGIRIIPLISCSTPIPGIELYSRRALEGTRGILLNHAFSVQNSLVQPPGSLQLYSPKGNRSGTEFTRPISTVLKRKPQTALQYESAEWRVNRNHLGICLSFPVENRH